MLKSNFERGMLKSITMDTGAAGSETKRSYYDEHIYGDLESFICGGMLPDGKKIAIEPPSFEDVVTKINSYALRQDLRVRVISETLGVLLSKLDGGSSRPAFLVSYLCREAIKSIVIN